MARPTPLSGFPEWLPAGRIVEQHILDALRRTFELHGFAGIETRAVEPLDQLLRKGETSKEVYVLRRLQEEDGGKDAGITCHIERFWCTLRQRCGRFVRKTLSFSKCPLNHVGALWYFIRHYNASLL